MAINHFSGHLLLLPNFNHGLLRHCSLHNLNLGLAATANGSSLLLGQTHLLLWKVYIWCLRVIDHLFHNQSQGFFLPIWISSGTQMHWQWTNGWQWPTGILKYGAKKSGWSVANPCSENPLIFGEWFSQFFIWTPLGKASQIFNYIFWLIQTNVTYYHH